MRQLATVVVFAVSVSCEVVNCQTGDSQPAFEVAAVKPSPVRQGRTQMEPSPNGMTVRNASLRTCMQWAYEVRRDQIAGPDWLRTELYDIFAKSSGPSTDAERRLMMRTLLAERFHLVFHRETKTLPVYEMTVGKGGPKLRESKPGGPTGTMVQTADSYELKSISMADFGVRLFELGAVDYPVSDRTGLQGIFDISLRFYDGYRPRMDAPGAASTFAIMEGLGLKLELKKVPTEILVVDQAEKVPTEN